MERWNDHRSMNLILVLVATIDALFASIVDWSFYILLTRRQRW